MRSEREAYDTAAHPVSASDLREGTIYFFLNYVDDELLIPTMETVVFIGKNLEAGDSGRVYFQDISSYREGVRYSTNIKSDYASYYSGSEKEVAHVFEFEYALDELKRCAWRRRRRAVGKPESE
jgi:hypothetical protein